MINSPTRQTTPRTILVVEDEPTLATAIAQRITAEGWSARVASDGASAVQAAKQLRPDLVIMDIMLPVMDGLEATKRIVADRPVPVLILTARDAEADKVQTAPALPEEAEAVSPLSGMNFLCAEDNALNAAILELLLETKGARCTICSNGQEIVDAFASVKPGEYDMILMDVQMPVMDGLEATQRIRSGENPLGRTIPILAMTANAFLEDMQKSREAGMDEHLSKPVDINALEQTVKRFRVTPPRK